MAGMGSLGHPSVSRPGAHAGGFGAEGAQAAPAQRVLVVVGAEPGKTRAAKRLVARLGGHVGQRLAIVDGFTARVPAGAIPRLRRAGAIRSVARDVRMTLSTATPAEDGADAGAGDGGGAPGPTAAPARRAGGGPGPPAIDPPPAEIPTDVPADEAAREVILDAAEDAAAGSSLEPEQVASGEDSVPAGQDAVVDPPRPSRRRPTTARSAPASRST